MMSDEPLSLEELLGTGQKAFVSRQHSDVATSDRHYAYSWGMAYCLTFRVNRLGTADLDQYVQKSAKDAAPVGRFEKLVEMRIARFEQHWRDYVLKLRSPK